MSVSEIPIDDIVVEGRFRTDLGDLTPLADSIEALGVLHPIVVAPTVDGEYRLIAGRRRMEACRLLRWETIPARLVPLSPSDWLQAEYDENEARKAFTHSERVALARALEPEFKAAAKERQGTRTDLQPREKLSQSAPTRVRDQVAEAVGLSGPTLAKATAVVDAADEHPELAPVVEAMDSKTISVAEADRQVKAYLNEDGLLDLHATQKKVLRRLGQVAALGADIPAESFHEYADADLWQALEQAVRWLTDYQRRALAARPQLRAIQGGQP